MDDYIINSLTT